jgi:hypothetical protein
MRFDWHTLAGLIPNRPVHSAASATVTSFTVYVHEDDYGHRDAIHADHSGQAPPGVYNISLISGQKTGVDL